MSRLRPTGQAAEAIRDRVEAPSRVFASRTVDQRCVSKAVYSCRRESARPQAQTFVSVRATTRGSQFSTSGPLADPVAVAIDPANGNIFVTVEESLEVQVFNAAGRFLTAFGAGLFSGIPEGIAIDPVTHNVFVSDTFGDRVLVFAQGGGKKKKKKNKPYALDHAVRLVGER